ncbi:class I tRNA ligase family protein [symbiont of Argiope bruennichi]|uniref:class I tRNA ligase family protein n=1 Tax=symbiont of Argiope bruennichi TaxID=2810479 RepID=UPI003DA4B61B
MKKNFFSDIEKKWLNRLKSLNFYQFKDDLSKKKKYILDMFPYPSGSGLHVGHLKGYFATDLLSRYYHLKGYAVFHPMGWDSFGLPAEQAALKENIDPALYVEKNIKNFKKQLLDLGLWYHFSNEIRTSDKEYYKWTQWIFLQLIKKNYAFKKETYVNFCEKLNTVLANEEIIYENGVPLSERGNFPITRIKTNQWVIDLKSKANSLLSNLNFLNWPKEIKELQKNWIGKQETLLLKLLLVEKDAFFSVYFDQFEKTNRIDLIIADVDSEITNFLFKNDLFDENLKLEIQKISNLGAVYCENNNVFLKSNFHFYHPITLEKIPIFFSVLNNNSCFAYNQNYSKFAKLICEKEKISKKEKLDANISFCGKLVVRYKLNDWIFSRQRYWGEPFPVYYKNEKIHLFDCQDLPIEIVKNIDIKEIYKNFPPLKGIKNWEVFNKISAKWDDNVMPQWAGSCWYYLGYLLKNENSHKLIDLNSHKAKKIFDRWLPVDIYVGGKEHAVLHLLYSRFWHHFLYDENIVGSKEPFDYLYNQGLILTKDHKKMSKSKGEVVSPNELSQIYGADTLRGYLFFLSSLFDSAVWENNNLEPMENFLKNNLFLFFKDIKFCDGDDLNIKKDFNFYLASLEKNFLKLKFNVSISNVMVFLKKIKKQEKITKELLKKFLISIYPLFPFISLELFDYHFSKFIHLENWPTLYKIDIKDEKIIKLIIQINGKFKQIIEIQEELDEKNLLFELKKLTLKKVVQESLSKAKNIKKIRKDLVNIITI